MLWYNQIIKKDFLILSTGQQMLSRWILAISQIVFFLSNEAVATSPKEINERISKSVVLLTTDTGTGTGFYSDNELIITNYHIISNAKKIKVKTFEKEFELDVDDRLMYVSKDSDIAVLFTENEGRPIEATKQAQSTGDKVYTIGFPNGVGPTFQEGIINRIYEKKTKSLQVSTPTLPGSSGSPIVNSEGHLIGIIHSGYTNKDSFGFGSSINPINIARLHSLKLVEAIVDKSEECSKNSSSVCLELAWLFYKNHLYDNAEKLISGMCDQNVQPDACLLLGYISLYGNRADPHNAFIYFEKGCKQNDATICAIKEYLQIKILPKKLEQDLGNGFYFIPNSFFIELNAEITKYSSDEDVTSILDEYDSRIFAYAATPNNRSSSRIALSIDTHSESELSQIKKSTISEFAESLEKQAVDKYGAAYKIEEYEGGRNPFIALTLQKNEAECDVIHFSFSDKNYYQGIQTNILPCDKARKRLVLDKIQQSFYTKNSRNIFRIGYLDWIAKYTTEILLAVFFVISGLRWFVSYRKELYRTS